MWTLVGPNCAPSPVYGATSSDQLLFAEPFLGRCVSINDSDLKAAGCGVVPTRYAHLADWTIGNMHAADGNYFNRLSEQLPRTYLVKKLIYMYTGPHKGSDVHEE